MKYTRLTLFILIEMFIHLPLIYFFGDPTKEGSSLQGDGMGMVLLFFLLYVLPVFYIISGIMLAAILRTDKELGIGFTIVMLASFFIWLIQFQRLGIVLSGIIILSLVISGYCFLILSISYVITNRIIALLKFIRRKLLIKKSEPRCWNDGA